MRSSFTLHFPILSFPSSRREIIETNLQNLNTASPILLCNHLAPRAGHRAAPERPYLQAGASRLDAAADSPSIIRLLPPRSSRGQWAPGGAAPAGRALPCARRAAPRLGGQRAPEPLRSPRPGCDRSSPEGMVWELSARCESPLIIWDITQAKELLCQCRRNNRRKSIPKKVGKSRGDLVQCISAQYWQNQGNVGALDSRKLTENATISRSIRAILPKMCMGDKGWER
ncbi:PREDICTED: uncharacterized protein LOC106148119 [Chinchilla lanigera]|uniref:uncharacterized protein LOC106148119 n=1 Tax=Chinchilla lanigera TaxID=34839 RepID=UPI00069678A2|nr:PREDICTED: uncharacterized protein LOC106148119 [Chinchilla lanigera]